MSLSKKECNFHLNSVFFLSIMLGPKARLRPTPCVAEGHYWTRKGSIEPVRVPTIHEVDQSTGEALVV